MKKCRSLFISDIHLGSKHSKAKELLEYLKDIDFDNLYIIGDFVDILSLQSKWHWTEDHNTVIQKVLRYARKGKKVVWLCGNHEAFLRGFVNHNFGDIEFVNYYIHSGPTDKKYLIMHGDIFDHKFIKSLGIMYWLGDKAYDVVIHINNMFNFCRKLVGKEYWSLAGYLKSKVKGALSFLNDFEKMLYDETKRKECVGVLYGHTHTPSLKNVNDIIIGNTGDWVDNCTSIIELEDGSFELWNTRKDILISKVV